MLTKFYFTQIESGITYISYRSIAKSLRKLLLLLNCYFNEAPCLHPTSQVWFMKFYLLLDWKSWAYTWRFSHKQEPIDGTCLWTLTFRLEVKTYLELRILKWGAFDSQITRQETIISLQNSISSTTPVQDFVK